MDQMRKGIKQFSGGLVQYSDQYLSEASKMKCWVGSREKEERGTYRVVIWPLCQKLSCHIIPPRYLRR